MTLYERFRKARDSYRACFERDEWRTDEGRLTQNASRVLVELREFCRADATTFDADPRTHALLEGRREVWLRLSAYINLTDTELAKLIDPDDPLNQPQKEASHD